MVIGGVISPLIWVIITVTLHITPHEPPSTKVYYCMRGFIIVTGSWGLLYHNGIGDYYNKRLAS